MLTYTRFAAGGVLAALLTATVTLTSRALFAPHGQNAPAALVQNSGAPVIVELFTSEGCSSCPSADKVLADLKRTQPIEGARIIVLSEHVDYWNYIGWTDPFSSPAYTARQQAYSRAFHLNGVYTPQAVVDGQAELVGSERETLEQDIRRAARLPKATVEIAPVTENGNDIRIVARGLPAMSGGEGAEVMLAVTQDGLSSRVTRGENAGRTLAHVSVARSLRSLGNTMGRDTFRTTAHLDIAFNASNASNDRRGDMEAVVFVQDRRTHRILGANALKLAGK